MIYLKGVGDVKEGAECGREVGPDHEVGRGAITTC